MNWQPEPEIASFDGLNDIFQTYSDIIFNRSKIVVWMHGNVFNFKILMPKVAIKSIPWGTILSCMAYFVFT